MEKNCEGNVLRIVNGAFSVVSGKNVTYFRPRITIVLFLPLNASIRIKKFIIKKV